jgi:hypothetical protein
MVDGTVVVPIEVGAVGGSVGAAATTVVAGTVSTGPAERPWAAVAQPAADAVITRATAISDGRLAEKAKRRS